MRRWYDSREEAIEVARGSGYPLWKVQRMTRVRHGTRWSWEKRPVGELKWYVGYDLPKFARRWECQEVSKDL